MSLILLLIFIIFPSLKTSKRIPYFIKVIMILSLLFAFLLTIYLSFHSQFIPNNSIFIYNWDIIISILFSLYLLYSANYKKKHIAKEFNSYYKKLTILSTPFLFYLVIQDIFYPFHYYSKKQNYNIEAIIIDKNYNHYHKSFGSNYRIVFKNNMERFSDHTDLYMTKNDYDKFNFDDNIIVNFEKSKFGYTPKSIELKNEILWHTDNFTN